MTTDNTDRKIYRSRWDAFTWLCLLFTAACCLWPVLIDDDPTVPLVLAAVFTPLMAVLFLSFYYRIDGEWLVVYQLFRPTRFPIRRIARISPTNSILSSPAASLSGRLAIRFDDPGILRSRDPLVISPVRRDEFIARLKAVNPDIIYG